ncbi:ABC transporter substrate-binding protein [Phreatobacter stygius]|uniref:ABC transporter substrate-binding protein n=1 Tax=Phreatobacter stygius TaxID=1940610 RepID=A0A4D7AZS6_9HYPH|nr:ABC transporter substrate-binding protein [Phreatobacter stygius]QCI65871.1 ABC transporter substrate-binding protein [Phreatobacter stygius]
MTTTRRSFMTTTAAIAGSVALPGYLRAQSATIELSCQYSTPVLFKDLIEKLAAEFQAKNPTIKITLRAPEVGYEEILQRNLRDVVTSTLPDIAFHGLNRQRTLEERGIPVNLKPFMDADPETASLGFSPTLLSLGQVGAKQTGIGFALSTPILYYNTELVTAAGGNPDQLPTSWDELIALAGAIANPGQNRAGLFFDWTITGNWSWQALVLAHGGTMLNAEETRVAFSEEPGQKAIRVLRKMVDAGKMADIQSATAFQDFFSGRLGISMQSTAQLARYNREIGGRFKLVCGRFPLSAATPRLPAGGNVAMMFTKDRAKQEAAWKFIKFATGPIGATAMVNATGYMPGTTVPAERDDLLGKFYRDNPNHMVAIRQQDVITGWYAFPGQNALRITDVINDHIQTVVNKSREPEAALTSMATAVQGLLPRRTG